MQPQECRVGHKFSVACHRRFATRAGAMQLGGVGSHGPFAAGSRGELVPTDPCFYCSRPPVGPMRESHRFTPRGFRPALGAARRPTSARKSRRSLAAFRVPMSPVPHAGWSLQLVER